jgi:hypothetical protein
MEGRTWEKIDEDLCKDGEMTHMKWRHWRRKEKYGEVALRLPVSTAALTHLSLREHFGQQHFSLNRNQGYCLEREVVKLLEVVRHIGRNYSYNVLYATAKLSILIESRFWIREKHFSLVV